MWLRRTSGCELRLWRRTKRQNENGTHIAVNPVFVAHRSRVRLVLTRRLSPPHVVRGCCQSRWAQVRGCCRSHGVGVLGASLGASAPIKPEKSKCSCTFARAENSEGQRDCPLARFELRKGQRDCPCARFEFRKGHLNCPLARFESSKGQRGCPFARREIREGQINCPFRFRVGSRGNVDCPSARAEI